MNSETRIEKIMQAFLDSRKRGVRADKEFASKVMASVQRWEEQEGRRAPGLRPGRGAPGFRSPFRAWLDFLQLPGPRLAFSALLVASICGLVYFAGRPQPALPLPDSTRIKGEGFRLGFLLKRQGRVVPAVPGTEFLPGDLLQAVYSAPVRGRFHLFSMDAEGNILCFSCASKDTLLPAGQDRPLSYALELDASRKREVFAGFWSERAVPSSEVFAMLRNAWQAAGHDLEKLPAALRPRLSPGLEVSIFPIHKQETIIHGTH